MGQLLYRHRLRLPDGLLHARHHRSVDLHLRFRARHFQGGVKGTEAPRSWSLLRILVTPFSISWIPFAFHRYGFSPKSYVCWIVDDCADGMHGGPMKGHLLQLLVSTLPAACILGVGLGLLCLVTVTFRRRLGEHKLMHQYWMALREIKPLLIYPTVSCAIAILGCCFHIYMMTDPHSKPAVFLLASSGLFQVLTVVLPISLFCHPGYKKKAGARLKFLFTVESKFTLANSTTAKAEEQVKILSEVKEVNI